jgi:hypothetical protein
MVNLNAGNPGTDKLTCRAEAPYRAWLSDCSLCVHSLEFEDCVGHPVCENHGALLRTTALKERDPALPAKSPRYRPAVLARISTPDSLDREVGQ